MIQKYSEIGVVDKAGIPVTRTILSISTYAVSVWRNGPNWLVAGIPVLSTTNVRKMLSGALVNARNIKNCFLPRKQTLTGTFCFRKFYRFFEFF